MSKKISELSDASALDGSEQLEVVQSGSSSKVTVNDLLPVQLQADKNIDLNGHYFDFIHTDTWFTVDPNNKLARLRAFDPDSMTTNAKIDLGVEGSTIVGTFSGNFGSEMLFKIVGYADETSSKLTYTALAHIFPDVVALDFANDGAAASGGVVVGQVYHTSGALKIRLS